MTVNVVSTIRPALFRSPVTGKLLLAGGTVISVNGQPASGYPEVPEGTTMADIQWTVPVTPTAVSPRTFRQFQVQGQHGTYTVTIAPNRITCTCPSYTFRKTCKHVKAVAHT
jgi:hypothetical protein